MVGRRFVRMEVLSGRRFVRTGLDVFSGRHFVRTGLGMVSQKNAAVLLDIGILEEIDSFD